MKKADFTALLAKKIDKTTKETDRIVDGFWELVTNVLKKGDEIVFPYGKFILKKRPARRGRNPHTGEPIKIAAKVVPQFRAGKRFSGAFAR